MTTLTHCLLTGYQLDAPVQIVGPMIEYEFILTGKVKISLAVATVHQTSRNYHHPILAGICRNAAENNVEPPEITGSFKLHDLPKLPIPKSFREKTAHLLKFIYDRGGNDFKEFRFNSSRDWTICYGEDHLEMNKVLEHLNKKGLIDIGHDIVMAQGVTEFVDVVMTDYGIAEVEKGKPKLPMIGLVDQMIATGDAAVDEKINVARELFFREPQTKEHMRSACVALAAVLEPLRDELTPTFTVADVNEFFLIVNRFDIRHNKASTANLEHPEQLEWVFYSLLNTINTYTKLKSRLLLL